MAGWTSKDREWIEWDGSINVTNQLTSKSITTEGGIVNGQLHIVHGGLSSFKVGSGSGFDNFKVDVGTETNYSKTLIPQEDDTSSLGNASNQWKHIYYSGVLVKDGTVEPYLEKTGGTITGDLTVTGDVVANGTITIDSAVKVPGCCIWAEEAGSLSTSVSSGLQWSFGNGAVNKSGVTMPASGKIYATSINWGLDGGSNGDGSVEICINRNYAGTTLAMTPGTGNYGSNYYTDATGVSFNAGDDVGFRTKTNDSGTAPKNMVCAMWIVFD